MHSIKSAERDSPHSYANNSFTQLSILRNVTSVTFSSHKGDFTKSTGTTGFILSIIQTCPAFIKA